MTPLTEEWVGKAEGDFQVAIHEWEAQDPVYDAICFHSQQCAEKYFKALLQNQGEDPPRTHNLMVLVELIKDNRDFLEKSEQVGQLEFYAIAFRYPGETADRIDAQEAVEIMKTIRHLTRKRLGLEPDGK